MKFLCLECDDVMDFAERQLPGDGTFAAVFTCGSCEREIAMLANPMETQLVSSMGVRIGGRELPEQPMELTRTSLDGARDEAFELEDAEVVSSPDQGLQRPASDDTRAGSPEGAGKADATPEEAGPVEWSPAAVERLQKVPRFVRGMVKRIYTDYAKERGIRRMTPEAMDRARSDLGLEGM